MDNRRDKTPSVKPRSMRRLSASLTRYLELEDIAKEFEASSKVEFIV